VPGPVDSAGFPPGAWRPPVPFTVDGARYRAEVEVGLVASGAVFTGKDTVEPRAVGIQLFHPAFFGPSNAKEHLARLERTLRYQHPNLAPTHAVGEAFGTRYAVSAAIVGQPLTHWVRGAGDLSTTDVYRVVGQIIQALSAIHAEGGVHGSLSPDTLRVVNEQAWIVNPWTLDTPADLPPDALPAPRTSWLAPELTFSGGNQGPETDVFGVGLALGYLLARGLTEPGHSLLVQGIDVPPAVDDVYVRATARQREGRYRDLHELAEALEAAAGPDWRAAQRIKPAEPSARALTIEVLESVAVAAPKAVASPEVIESVPVKGKDIESTSEDEAIPAFAAPVEAAVPEVVGQDALVAEPAAGSLEALPRAGKRKVAKTLVSGSPRAQREEAARSQVPLTPIAVERSVSDTDTAPPPTPGFVAALASHASSSLEALDPGLIASVGGPPPLPPLPPGPPPVSRSAKRPTMIGAPLRPPSSPGTPMLPEVGSAAVELHEPTIVEPFAPSLLELDVFGVADAHAAAPKRQQDPFVEAPEPPPSEWSDSPFAASGTSGSGGSDIFATASSGPLTDRPFTDQSMSAGSLRLRRPDAPVTRPKERAYGSNTVHSVVGVPPTRKKRFPWTVVLAVLAGIVVAAVLFAVTSGGGKTPTPPTDTALANTAPGTKSTTMVVVPAEQDAGAAQVASAAPDTQVIDTQVVDTQVVETAPETIAETVAETEPETVSDITPDTLPLVDTTVQMTAEVLVAATLPLADATTSPADAVAPSVDTVVAVADTAEAPDAAPPSDFVPTDPAKVSCPGGMAKMKRKIQVTLAGGAKVDDWEVVCIDLYEYPGAGAPPRTGIDISGARGACIAKGKRLCTRSEWRRACGGKYPYGSSYDASACASAHDDGSPGAVVAAGSKRGCRSPSGAFDMVGNVAEWTSDGTVNGGSAYKNGADGTCSSGSKRVGGAPYVGFRCCADAK